MAWLRARVRSRGCANPANPSSGRASVFVFCSLWGRLFIDAMVVSNRPFLPGLRPGPPRLGLLPEYRRDHLSHRIPSRRTCSRAF
jgi:hypothetical protein